VFALALALSVVGLLVGPALTSWARGRAVALAALDGATLGIIPALLLARLLPHLVEAVGAAAVVAVAGGYVGYLLIESRGHRRAAQLGLMLVLPTLALHSFLDGTALAIACTRPDVSVAGTALAGALVVHKVPEGLFVSSRLTPHLAGLRSFAPVLTLGATTVLGGLTGRELLAHAPDATLHVLVAVGIGIMLRMVVHRHGETEVTPAERAASACAFLGALVLVVATPSPDRVFDESQPDELSAAQALVPLFLESAPWLLLVLAGSELVQRRWPEPGPHGRPSAWVATTTVSVGLLGFVGAAARALLDPLLRRLAWRAEASPPPYYRWSDVAARAQFVLPSYVAGVVLATAMEAALPRESLVAPSWTAVPAAIVAAVALPIGAPGACVVGAVAVHKGAPLAAGLAFMLTQATVRSQGRAALGTRLLLLVAPAGASALVAYVPLGAGPPSLHDLGQHTHSAIEWASAAALVAWTVAQIVSRGPRTWARAAVVGAGGA